MAPKRDIDKLWILKREIVMRELIDEMGGPDVAAHRLVKRGVNAIEFAIVQVGGVGKAAQAAGCTRQHFTKSLMRRPVIKWSTGQSHGLARASGVPLELLLAAPPLIEEGQPAAPPKKPSKTRRAK